MAIDFIPARADRTQHPYVNQLISTILSRSMDLDLGDGVLYYGWPKFTDYESIRHYVDIALVSSIKGLVLVRVAAAHNPRKILEMSESISQATATAVSQLIRSPLLRGRGQRLKLEVTSIIFAPGAVDNAEDEVCVFGSEANFLSFLSAIEDQNLSSAQVNEARSILEGTKALARVGKRIVENPERQRLAFVLSKLEDEIATFDARQRQVALTALGGPQRIRGLAGSGKTVILAMKAALTHMDNPEAKILVTYYTRSLKDQLTKLITRFYRHFAEGDPDWRRIDVFHGWGRKELPGAYRETCKRLGLAPLVYTEARAAAAAGQHPFDYACRSLLSSGKVESYYDLILIDEGQDFPGSFYEMCFFLAKGHRDQKQIVWAYDELQDVFNVKVPTPDQLFGKDTDTEPRISLSRALPEGADTNDFVLPKCYRNQRDVLVLAHSIGFGLYGQPVQMLQNERHWEDVGYEIVSGRMDVGTQITIERPSQNSPTQLNTPQNVPLIKVKGFSSADEEVKFCAAEVQSFISGGLQPEDIMIIAIDDKVAQNYLSRVSHELARLEIETNNITADRYGEPAFTLDGKVTLTTVYRAKGNEAAVVIVLGCDGVPLNSRVGRNRLFTAFTRTKGWLRITGIKPHFERVEYEILTALKHSPQMKFAVPDPAKIEFIQRDLSEKSAKLLRAQAEMERLKENLGLTDDDLQTIISGSRQNGRS